MFLLKTLGNVIFGKGDGELVQLPQGKFSYLSPNASEPKQVVYEEASISIKKTTVPFQYELIVSKATDEVEDAEASFLIDRCLLFRTDGVRLVWADLEDNTGRCGWEFEAQGSTSVSIDLFEEMMVSCMFEREFQKSHESAAEKELTDFLKQIEEQVGQSVVGVAGTATIPTAPFKKTPIKAPPAPETPVKMPAIEVPQGTCIVSLHTKLFVFDTAMASFVPYLQVVKAEILQTGRYQYVLVLYSEGVPVLCQPVEPRMNTHFDHNHYSFIWVWYDPTTDLPSISWCLKFEQETESDFKAFAEVIKQALFEVTNQAEFVKQKTYDKDYMDELLDNMEMDIDEELEDDDEVPVLETPKKSTRPVMIESDDDDETTVEADGKSKNSLLAVGYKHNRSFVVRGNRIGVFKHTEDDELEFATTINNIGTVGGKYFSPRKVMLHNQDSNLLMMNPDDQNKIHVMDLEYGKVIDEWKVDDYKTVQEIAPETKYAQQTSAQTLVGINQSAVFGIDSRLSGNKIIGEKTKQYSKNLGFSATCTTGKGDIAVGSLKGEIRLYNKLGKDAKTLLPGLGDAIIGMDSTENGKFILATCKKYLMVINTQAEGEEKSAFQKSYKATPRRLQLKPEHVAWMGKEVSFTPAKFNTGVGEEKTIVTSTGPYVITWNFRRVKLGQLYDYSIKMYSEDVVADNFKFGADKSIIVALPSNVEMTAKSQLQTPTKLLKSRNNIVNSPY